MLFNPEDARGIVSIKIVSKALANFVQFTVICCRIDTCIVGEDSTCEREKHEVCKTKLGVSSCFCKPGYGRRKHRQKCQSESFQG